MGLSCNIAAPLASRFRSGPRTFSSPCAIGPRLLGLFHQAGPSRCQPISPNRDAGSPSHRHEEPRLPPRPEPLPGRVPRYPEPSLNIGRLDLNGPRRGRDCAGRQPGEYLLLAARQVLPRGGLGNHGPAQHCRSLVERVRRLGQDANEVLDPRSVVRIVPALVEVHREAHLQICVVSRPVRVEVLVESVVGPPWAQWWR
jgi:hypothetical protein